MKQSTLGSCIRELRIQNHMTQAKLADQLGVTDKAVSKWERDVSWPDIALFPKLADLLGITVGDLLKECTGECRPSRLLQIFQMSHDIRTPLHAMIGFVEMARYYQDDPEMQSHYLDSTLVAGEYLLSVIDRAMLVAGQDGRRQQEQDLAAAGKGLEEYLRTRVPPVRARREGAAGREDFDFSGKRILIAEDMAVNREIAGELLRQKGAEVDFAEDGQVCLEKLEKAPGGHYDLIIMDITMPGMDGLEAAKRIRALPDPAKAGIPIIAMSANVYDKDRAAALEAGMDDFAEKPVFLDRWFEVLARYLGN